MAPGIDLHVHSTYSDGTYTTKELVQYAKNINLLAIALTDHDTVKGNHEMRKLCMEESIDFVSGIELSTQYHFSSSTQEVHLLGLFVDETKPVFHSYEEEFAKSRDMRNQQIVEKLNDHGFSITMNELQKTYPNSVLTRAHIGRYLFDTKQVPSINHAFKQYLGDNACCYVDRKKIETREAISLVHEAGGLAIIAHPPLYNLKAKALDSMICDLKNHGLNGIEAVYSTYHNNEEHDMKALAQKYQLLISGGSDFHGSNKPYIHLGKGRGNLYVPYEIYENLSKIHSHS